MAKKVEGIKYITLGEHWRELYIKGTPIISIADEFYENKQVVSRSIWLAKIPNDIKEVIRNNPEVFTCRLLLNGFAGKRRLCELDGFKFLRTEVHRMAKAGAGSVPKFPKPKKLKIKPIEIPKNESIKKAPLLQMNEVLEAEFQLKQSLGFHTRVSFDNEGAGEVRIFFQNKKALHSLIEMLNPNLLDKAGSI